MNSELAERLLNWKFKSALKYLSAEDRETKKIVKALADMFGDCGWFDGQMGRLISAMVEKITKEAMRR